jgi:hypothetical protein
VPVSSRVSAACAEANCGSPHYCDRDLLSEHGLYYWANRDCVDVNPGAGLKFVRIVVIACSFTLSLQVASFQGWRVAVDTRRGDRPRESIQCCNNTRASCGEAGDCQIFIEPKETMLKFCQIIFLAAEFDPGQCYCRVSNVETSC